MNATQVDDVPRTLALATGLWATLVTSLTRAEVFARQPEEVLAALAILATALAVATVTVDARVRAWLRARGAWSAKIALFGLAFTLVGTGAGLALEPESRPGEFPWPLVLLLGVPLTIAATTAAACAAWCERTAVPAVTLRREAIAKTGC